jgi:flagellar biosynthesis/type III secretory pathway protein FliH
LALCRRLYDEGFSQKDVLLIHGLIDQLMILPRPLMIRFRQEIFAIEKEKNMPYVDTLTRMSHEEGREEGLQEGRQEGRQEGSLAQARESVIEALEIRFGEVSNDLRQRITALDNLRTLKIQLRRAITVPSLDQF